MGQKQSKLLTERLIKSSNIAPTTFFLYFLSKNNYLEERREKKEELRVTSWL